MLRHPILGAGEVVMILMKPSTETFYMSVSMIQPSCGMLGTPTNPTPKGINRNHRNNGRRHDGTTCMATEKGYNELFSVARNVIILLNFVKVATVTCEPSGVAILFKLSVCQAQNTEVFPSKPETIENVLSV